MHGRNGFTLIELLIVIAIIGILASIIFASLASARTKARDSSVKAELKSIYTQIESDQDSGGYGPRRGSGNCPTFDDGTIFYSNIALRNLISSAQDANGGTAVKCAAGGPDPSTATTWAVASPLPSLGTGVGAQWWCVDSSGNIKLSYNGDRNHFLISILKKFTDVAYAKSVIVGPDLGGGVSPAACP